MVERRYLSCRHLQRIICARLGTRNSDISWFPTRAPLCRGYTRCIIGPLAGGRVQDFFLYGGACLESSTAHKGAWDPYVPMGLACSEKLCATYDSGCIRRTVSYFELMIYISIRPQIDALSLLGRRRSRFRVTSPAWQVLGQCTPNTWPARADKIRSASSRPDQTICMRACH